MSSRFIADPPLPITLGSLAKHLRRMLVSFGWIMWQVVTPFKSRPESIDELPEPAVKVTESQVKQCQWIFDQAAGRRVHLEQKAQSTFGLMLFLVPLMSSLFVFVISKPPGSHASLRVVAIATIGLSAVLLFLGFVAAVRGISVKAIETLFVHSVLDDAGQFREYKEKFHARGLLSCAAMNEAMNDHIAQFVKGAHVLTPASLIAFVVAAVPSSYVFSGLPVSPAETKIVGSVNVASPEVMAMRDELTNLKADVRSSVSKNVVAEDNLRRLEEKFAKLDGMLTKMRKEMPAGTARK